EQNTIRKVEIATGIVTTIAGTAGVGGITNDTGAAARFNGVYGLWGDGTNLYIAGLGNDCSIRKLVLATGTVTTLSGSALNCSFQDGPAGSALFAAPSG